MRFIRKHIYLVNVILCLAIILIALYLNSIYPFGKELLGKSDAFVQFKPMLYNFIMKIKTGTLLNYSFNNGLGNAFIFDFWYYLASPINLIALFFNSPNSMYLSTVLVKIAIASICMTFYVKKKSNNYSVIIISTLAYVFSGWLLAYYYYTPWLDIFMVFPLFQYGLEKLLDENKYHIYIFTLSYMMATNMYLCFSVCVYTILYFVVYRLLYKKDSLKKKLLSFDYIALATLFSFLLVFFYLYVAYDIIIKTKLFFDSSISVKYPLTVMEFIKSLFYGNIGLTIDEGITFPNISCSLIILFSFIYSFFNKGISKRNKLFILGITVLCILILFIPQLDFVMNAFHNIRGLTYRYSFIFIFLAIRLFIENINTTKEIDKKACMISLIIIILLYIIAWSKIPTNIKIFNITFFLCYLVCLLFYKDLHFKKPIIITVLILEIICSAYFNVGSGVSEKELTPNFNRKNDSFRIASMDIPNEYANANLYFNKKALYLMTSVTYNKAVVLFSNMGCQTFENTYVSCLLDDDITHLLFNVKDNDSYLEKIYAVNKEILDTSLDEGNIKYNIESIIFNMTGIKDIYDKEVLKGKKEGNYYKFKTDKDYFLIEIKNDYGGVNIIPQDYKSFNQEVKHGEETATIYTVNEKKIKEIYDYLKKNQIQYSYYNDNHIKGDINVDKGQMIFTSIPYDKDWVVKVDGKKVDTIELLDSLIGIEVKPGKHTIELEYKTHYFVPALVSIFSLIVLIIDYIRKRIKQ